MSRTQTIYVNLPRLLSMGQSASLIIRLMMACNDISLANQCLKRFQEEQDPIRKHVQKGALIYFLRLQCGHLKEAMSLIQEICNDQALLPKIEHCSQKVQKCFYQMKDCLRGGQNHQRFEDYVTKIRNKVSFHYDPQKVHVALEKLASRVDTSTSRITRGDDISLWRFELADAIHDSIICRQIWGIPEDADLREQADQKSDFASNLCLSFLEFCGEFIFSWIQENVAV